MVSYLDQKFVESRAYQIIRQTAATLSGIADVPIEVIKGNMTTTITGFAQALELLMNLAQEKINIQRYKGLGEMNPEQLWETTMDPSVRRLLKVRIEDAMAADDVFVTLMGDEVEPRRAFIENNALNAQVDI